MERRKSVTFADSATKRRASARSTSTTQRASHAPSPYNKRAADADATRNPPTPGGTETDGTFKFKRRKRPADAGAVAGATGAPELTRTIVTAAAKPTTPPPPTTTTTALALVAPTSDALADSLLPAPTLHGVPSEVLNAALQVCHDLQALGTPAPLAAVRDACLEELQRVGIEAGVDAQLAARERVLRKRMDELIHMQGEWEGLSDEVSLRPQSHCPFISLARAPPAASSGLNQRARFWLVWYFTLQDGRLTLASGRALGRVLSCVLSYTYSRPSRYHHHHPSLHLSELPPSPLLRCRRRLWKSIMSRSRQPWPRRSQNCPRRRLWMITSISYA